MNTDEKISSLLQSSPMKAPDGMNAEIMMRVCRMERRRKTRRRIIEISVGITVAVLALGLTVMAFIFVARMAGLTDWLVAVDEYVAAGFEHLRAFADSFTVKLILTVAVTAIVGRAAAALWQRKRNNV